MPVRPAVPVRPRTKAGGFPGESVSEIGDAGDLGALERKAR